jgi:hypothetical protein
LSKMGVDATVRFSGVVAGSTNRKVLARQLHCQVLEQI